MKIQLFKLCCS